MRSRPSLQVRSSQWEPRLQVRVSGPAQVLKPWCQLCVVQRGSGARLPAHTCPGHSGRCCPCLLGQQ